jgi:hypothetical protein
LYYRILKIGLLFVVLLIILKWSFAFQEQKKINSFVRKISEKAAYEDPLLNEIYKDFIAITGFSASNQSVKIKLAEFPFILNWMGFQDKETDIDLLSDMLGMAIGMDDDSKIEIYINYDDWTDLNLAEKRKLLYHELLHDCYNLEHVDEPCSIMAPQINDCRDFDLNKNLSQIIKQIQ